MFSQATSDGALTLTITFALGTDLDNAQVQVQNRVAQALPRLPQEVQRIGVTTEKASPDFIMVVHLVSPDERYDMLYLSNYAHLQVKDELTPHRRRRRRAGLRRRRVQHARVARSRSPGLASADRHRRRARHPRAERAGGGRRARRAAGAVRHHLPAVDQHAGPADHRGGVRRHRRARHARRPDHAAARRRPALELGSNRYSLRSLLDNKPAVAIGIFQRPGTNALEASTQVRATMERLKQRLPGRRRLPHRLRPDRVRARVDQTPWSRRCSRPSLLVVIVVMVFLQTWRASIIPLVAVPVSLVGTFAVMLRVRLLAEHAVALRPGAGHRHRRRRRDRGGGERGAAHRAGHDADGGDPQGDGRSVGPIIAIALVLCAVFVPTAFISGLTGQFYRQFALTIAISTVISAFNSLTLSPALASRLLRPHGAPRDRLQRGIDALFGWFFRAVQSRASRAGPAAYAGGVSRVLRVAAVALVALRRPGRPDRRVGFAHGAAGLRARRRTRTTWWRSRSCPMPPRSIAPSGDPRDVVARAGASGRGQLGGLPRAVDQRLRQRARTPASPSSRSSRRAIARISPASAPTPSSAI